MRGSCRCVAYSRTMWRRRRSRRRRRTGCCTSRCAPQRSQCSGLCIHAMVARDGGMASLLDPAQLHSLVGLPCGLRLPPWGECAWCPPVLSDGARMHPHCRSMFSSLRSCARPGAQVGRARQAAPRCDDRLRTRACHRLQRGRAAACGCLCLCWNKFVLEQAHCMLRRDMDILLQHGSAGGGGLSYFFTFDRECCCVCYERERLCVAAALVRWRWLGAQTLGCMWRTSGLSV